MVFVILSVICNDLAPSSSNAKQITNTTPAKTLSQSSGVYLITGHASVKIRLNFSPFS